MKNIKLSCFAFVLLLFTGPLLAEQLEQASASCQFTTLDGDPTYNLQELKGKVVYMDFWASWCPPCIKSFPFLNQLDQDLKDEGLHVVGINLDEKVVDAQAFLAKNPVDFSIVADLSKQCAKEFELMAMPTSFLIDRNGNVRHIHQGFRTGESEKLRALITQLLKE
ncbi:TlpA family protein disulfide reductase [Nitrosomonas supralitoralis]|uniref:Redoxin n=1 Tax=Nitrosomonas supralitoralis TaxID=2116706 RepID=A0A2P7NXD3_9PROT|nr:TlpA disulfide reductase family protein [Nitrosomonas supralitoralis]PSJ18130.1 redoxin [Nitrosomonas supralitoralis]